MPIYNKLVRDRIPEIINNTWSGKQSKDEFGQLAAAMMETQLQLKAMIENILKHSVLVK